MDVYDTASSSHVGHMVLGGDARSHIFRNLSPGSHYSVAVRATAGPFHTSTPNVTHCTREYDALLAALCPPPDLPLLGSNQRLYRCSQILSSSPTRASTQCSCPAGCNMGSLCMALWPGHPCPR